MKRPSAEEFQAIVDSLIADELAKTPDDEVLKVNMVMEKEGMRIDFTREKKDTTVGEEE